MTILTQDGLGHLLPKQGKTTTVWTVSNSVVLYDIIIDQETAWIWGARNSNILAGAYTPFLASSKTGLGWKEVTFYGFNQNTPRGIATNGSGTILAACHGARYSGSGFFKTLDGGRRWYEQTKLNEVPAYIYGVHYSSSWDKFIMWGGTGYNPLVPLTSHVRILSTSTVRSFTEDWAGTVSLFTNQSAEWVSHASGILPNGDRVDVMFQKDNHLAGQPQLFRRSVNSNLEFWAGVPILFTGTTSSGVTFSSPAGDYVVSVDFNGSCFLGITRYGYLVSSTDGLTWTFNPTRIVFGTPKKIWWDQDYADNVNTGRWVIVGTNSTFLTNTVNAGTGTWTSQIKMDTRNTLDFNSVTRLGSILLLVGQERRTQLGCVLLWQ